MYKLSFLLGMGMLLVACQGSQQNEDAKTSTDSALAALQKFYQQQSKAVQSFKISPDQTETIRGKENTRIKIPPKAFVFPGGQAVIEPIVIELQEYYKPGDMVLNNLTTTSNGQLLETGGMINLRVSSEGRDLKIREGKTLE